MMLLVTFLVGMAGVTTAYQRTTWWTPNSPVDLAHYNQIDFRYPDWVVSPRPPCLQEGVFPHPRSSNCTWYYRCTKAAFGPRFGTFYYECEPGTMFDDDLDQCVHPHSGYNCQAPSPPPTKPPPINYCNILQSSCKNYDSCISGRSSSLYLCKQETCTLTGVKDKCSFGQLWDVAAGRCVQEPRECPVVCTILNSSCKNYACTTQSTRVLCTLEQCTRSGVVTGVKNKCNGGQLWDVAARRCVDQPPACNPVGLNTTCTAVDCKPMKVCTGGVSYEQNLCKNEHCIREGQDLGVRLMCPNSLNLWDTEQKRCVPPPAANTCNCEYTATNCRQYDLCNPSGFKRLCDCSACQSGMMYDPSTKQCISKTALCPVLECVFRDTVCSCVNGQSLCTGCFLRGSLIPVSDFCKAQANPYFYHVEKDTCLYANAAYNRVATDGNCPRAGGNLPGVLRSDLPSLQCSLRNNNVIRCWSDDSY